ncbi:N-glycosylase/DNA lyase [Candidatus Dependentiae bacterium]|nr:N-glycosylase/DNA lyase [Candidatus Dependentiae bacterium]
MNKFKKLIPKLNKQTILKINQTLKSFELLNQKNNLYWFNELCFCILTANSKAETAIKIQIEMHPDGFLKKTSTEIAMTIRKYGHRFHNTKARFILYARKYMAIKTILQKQPLETHRIFLVKNIKGLGYKEASHFLRNVGYSNVAIIDRHILKFMLQNKLISQIPKTITPKKYLEYENILKNFDIPLNKLDLIIWAKMTGKVLK